MAEMALCFRDEKEIRPLTSDEVNSVTMVAQGASAIIHVMKRYAFDNPNGEASDLLGVYGCAFHVLELLMEPITDYLQEQEEAE